MDGRHVLAALAITALGRIGSGRCLSELIDASRHSDHARRIRVVSGLRLFRVEKADEPRVTRWAAAYLLEARARSVVTVGRAG